MLKLAGAGLLGTGLSGFGAPGLAATAAAAPGAPRPAPTWTKGFDGQRKAVLGDVRFLHPNMAGYHPDPSSMKDSAHDYMTFSTLNPYTRLVNRPFPQLGNWRRLANNEK